MLNQNKQDQEKGGINPLVAVAAVGAGIAVAGAVALKDKKLRNKVKEVLSDIKGHAQEYIDNKQNKAQDNIDKVEKEVKKTLKGKEKLRKK